MGLIMIRSIIHIHFKTCNQNKIELEIKINETVAFTHNYEILKFYIKLISTVHSLQLCKKSDNDFQSFSIW